MGVVVWARRMLVIVAGLLLASTVAAHHSSAIELNAGERGSRNVPVP